MTHEHEHEAAALRVALAYHRAWAAGDFEKAMTQVAPDIVCDAPAGTMTGAEALRAFMGPFVTILGSSRLLAAYGDDQTALLMYDAETRLPFEEARRRQQTG